MRIGSLALSATGQAQESKALERMLKEVGDKTAGVDLGGRTERARVKDASEAVTRAAADAQKAITEADAQSRKG